MATTQPRPAHLQATELDRLVFIRRNYGVLSRIARSLRPAVTPQHASQVFWRQRTNRRVSAAIDAVFVPWFAARAARAKRAS